MAALTTPFKFDSPAAALAAILDQVRPVDAAPTPLGEATGRVLAQPVHLDRPSPSADVSSMDGFAVRIRDLAHGRIPIVAEVRIGREPPPMPAVDHPACIRIVTGGAIPAGADAVVKREDVTEHESEISFAPSLASRVHPGDFIRRLGENAKPGHVVANAGTVITPALAGALAAVGVSRPLIARSLRVTLLTTGDEIVPIDAAQPTAWQLRNSNAAALHAMLRGVPLVGEINAAHVQDDEAAMLGAVRTALANTDAIVLSGGVSAGHRDFVPLALVESGVKVLFHGLPQRPGKPMLAGVTALGVPVLSLPGNPVSSMVTARRYLLPALAARAGRLEPAPVTRVVLRDADTQSIPLWWHRLVRLTAEGEGELLDNRGSGDLIAAGASDGFVEVPPHASGAGPWPYYAWIS